MSEVERIRSLATTFYPFVVSADIQTAGTGRGSNLWQSPPGGLWFSLCFQHPKSVTSMALYIGACIHQTLRLLFPQLTLKIKWTNDIYLGNSKLAGILCKFYPTENVYSIGIGINTNNTIDVEKLNATSLIDQFHHPVANHQIRDLICKSILCGLSSLDVNAYVEYCNQYLFGIGRAVRVENGQNVSSGLISKVNPDGSICLITDIQTVDVYSGSLVFE